MFDLSIFYVHSAHAQYQRWIKVVQCNFWSGSKHIMKCDFLSKAPSPRRRLGLETIFISVVVVRSLSSLYLHSRFKKKKNSFRNAKPPPAATHGWCVRCFWYAPLYIRLLFTLVCFACTQIEIEFNLYFMYTHNILHEYREPTREYFSNILLLLLFFFLIMFFILSNLSFSRQFVIPGWNSFDACISHTNQI